MADFDIKELDQDLRHVLEELDMEESTIPLKLWEANIRKFSDLTKDNIISRIPDGKIKPYRRDQLLQVAKWYQSYKDRGDETPPTVSKDFNYHVLNKATANEQAQTSSQSKLSSSTRESIIQSHLSNPTPQSQEIMNLAGLQTTDIQPVSKIIASMPKRLKRASRFDYKVLIEDTLQALSSRTQTCAIVFGNTQTGKSSVKGVYRCLGDYVKCPVFIITKGVA